MKTAISILTVLAAIPGAFAATHAVLPGGSIQEKIDLAQPGDIVAVFGGTYPGDVTINKSIRLVEVDGQDVTITGNVTWNNVNNAPPFEGFSVGSSGKGITVNNTTRLVIKNVDARAGFGLRATSGSRVDVLGGQYSVISQDGGELSVSNSSTTGALSTTVNCLKTVVFRTVVGGDAVWSSKASWFGYSRAQQFAFDGSNSSVVIVGCTIDSQSRAISSIRLEGSGNRFQVVNNSVLNARHGNDMWWHPSAYWVGADYPGRGIYANGQGSEVLVANNYISMIYSPAQYLIDTGHGEGIGTGNISRARVYSNIVVGARYGVKAPFGADVRNNCYHNLVSSSEFGGVVATGSIVANPLFVSGQTPLLQPTSPCINAGVNDPAFNDLNGTQNDIGPGGGCFFDPQGQTTGNPVVISFDLAPQQLLKGVDTQVTLSKGQAVSQP